MKTISEVISSGMCIGCGACNIYSKFNAMQYDSDGFLIPQDIHTTNIADFCPGIETKPLKGNFTHNLWGNVECSLTGFSKSDEVRHKGSSGGVLTQLAIYLLETGKVSGVLHVGVSDSDGVTNKTYISNDAKSVLARAGSRYSPSSVLSSLKNLIDADGTYLVIGRPCDISAIRAMMEKDRRLADKVYMLASFFCAGTPSQNATQDLIAMFTLNPDEVSHISYRGKGWPGKTEIKTQDSTYQLDYEESWGNVLNKKLHTRCKICADGVGQSADIVCADAWESDERGYPLFNESKGRSLILARSTFGKAVLNQMISAEVLDVKDYCLDNLEKIQPYQVNRKRNIFARTLAFKVLGKYVVKQGGYSIYRNAYENGFYKTCSNFYGMFKRLIGKAKGI
ncbi:Coenzyme F420 hydrogenase/dehydrogenase, beta subunit C-terminal domain [Pseudoalteromonas sp. MEBiC 03485]|uniref:Coenzyme F420 hydrogenase/dehydrogenase, beta subunit C-terminal domain n=1 Tax=Pseudoalteromonas sp. MEBiC 03485 TaxID=2571103 RepID=UPI00145A019B|nr:Coenzyme F420 hydrogenase/dehydrogenase, beta subunit C-terminal domain [Pseudoalteromonas sp. MEBiC 03485]